MLFKKELFMHKNNTKLMIFLLIHKHATNILTNLLHKIRTTLKRNSLAIANDKIIKQLEKDHKKKLYTWYTFVLTSNLTKKKENSLKKMENPSVLIRSSIIDFVCFGKFFISEILRK